MSKDDWKWLIGIIVGLVLGAGVSYATFTTNDAVLKTRVAQLESSSKQYQSDINILRVELSKVGTEIKNTDESYKALRNTLKDVANSTRDVAIALARLEERQAKTDKILEKIGEKFKIGME